MDKRQEAFFRELEVTFRTPGWARLMAGWKEELDAIPAQIFWSAKDMTEIQAARVRYELLASLLDLPNHHERAKLELFRQELDSDV